MHLTHVDTVVEDADAHFPAFDAGRWRVVAREAHAADARHAFAFEFVDYVSAGAGAGDGAPAGRGLPG
jgi:dihydrofolate reductase